MTEMEVMKKVFNIFVDSCEKAGVKFNKEEQVEEWPKVGDCFYTQNMIGEIDFFSWCEGMKWLPFKTSDLAEKYYSIIDIINNIVDELGRPTWGDFEDSDRYLYTIVFKTQIKCFDSYDRGSIYPQNTFFPWCKEKYLEQLLEKVSQEDLLWTFKKSMRLI